MDKAVEKNPIPSEIPSPELSQQMPQKKKISKPLLIVFMVVVLSVLSLVALMHVRGTKDITPVTNKDNSNAVLLPFTTPTPFQFTSVDTSTWQTLTDDTLGIKVKFPKDWHETSQKDISPGHVVLSSWTYDETWDSTKWNTRKKENQNVDVSLRAIDNTLPIDQWFEKFFKNDPLPDISEKKLVLIKNIQAVKVTNKRTWTDSYNKTHEETLDRYFIPQKNRIIEVSFNNTNPQDVQIYENVLNNLDTYDPPIINGTYKTSTENIFPQPIKDSQIYEEQLWDQHNYISAPRGNVESGELIFYSPDGEVYLISKALEEKIKQITGILKSPKNKDIVFISSIDEAAFSSPEGCVNRYSMLNLKTGELTEFYKDTPTTNDFTMCRKSVAGIQGSKLIVLGEPAQNSPGPCTNSWVNYKDKFLFLELADIKSGFQKFTVPDATVSWKLDDIGLKDPIYILFDNDNKEGAEESQMIREITGRDSKFRHKLEFCNQGVSHVLGVLQLADLFTGAICSKVNKARISESSGAIINYIEESNNWIPIDQSPKGLQSLFSRKFHYFDPDEK